MARDELARDGAALRGRLARETKGCRGQDAHRFVDASAEVGKVFDLVAGNSHLVCGSTLMAKQVRAVVGELLCDARGWSLAEVADLQQMRSRTGQWQEDVWG